MRLRAHTFFWILIVSLSNAGANDGATNRKVTDEGSARKVTEKATTKKVTDEASTKTITNKEVTKQSTRNEKKRLDDACQVAIQAKLSPIRQQRIDECVKTKEKGDKAACESFYRDYGERSGNQQQLFPEIPECAKAYNYK